MVSVGCGQQVLFKTKRCDNISWLCHRTTSSAATARTTELAH